jgi:hypothetical protein
MIRDFEQKVRADFNGIFGDILCLSHKDTAEDEKGNEISLKEGMYVKAFDLDGDENGNPDDIIAFGIVAPSPEPLRCLGSKWVMRIDPRGILHESDLRNVPVKTPSEREASGMTVNERLWVFGLMPAFDDAVARKDLNRLHAILKEIYLVEDNIEAVIDQVLNTGSPI